MTTLRFNLLGGFEARLASGEALRLKGRKTRALLAYLALRPDHRCSRDELVGLLWGDRGEAQARSSLRQSLSELRRALGEADRSPLVTERDSVALDSAAVAVDAAAFERSVDDGTPAALERAAELYRGDLLDGIGIHDPAFEAWLRDERRRLRDRACDALSRLLDYETAEGSERALATARRILALDPLREAAHRAAMRLQAARGERTLALKQYQACRDLLSAELGIPPEPETEALAAEIRDGAVRAGDAVDPAPARRAPAASMLSLSEKPSIAVLPFTNLSGDPEQEFFSDGITEDIITALSKLSKLFVVARTSTFTYKGRAIDIREVGREQGVRYVLEGSVQRGSDRLRITAQLVDATTGHHIWAQRYDRTMQDVFALQDEITREVTSALQVELTEGEQARLWASGTRNLEAWEAAIQVPELLHSHRRADVLPARRLAKRALQLDENYASAWAMLGWSYWNEAFNGWTDDPDAALGLALEAMERARAIDDSDPDTLALLAFLHLSLRRFDEASSLIEAAMALGPNNSFAPAVAANVALFCNRPRDMVPLLKRARRLCPIYPAWYVGDLAFAYLLMDRHREAIEIATEATGIDPDYIYSYQALAIAHAELGQAEEAHAAAANILRIEPKWTIRAFGECQPYRDEAVRDRMIRGLRKAGLPE